MSFAKKYIAAGVKVHAGTSSPPRDSTSSTPFTKAQSTADAALRLLALGLRDGERLVNPQRPAPRHERVGRQ